MRERRHALALAALVALYVVVMTSAQFKKYDALYMGFDLAVYEQITWNTAHGRPFATSMFNFSSSTLGQDLTLLHAIVAVPYALFPSTYTLLFLETLAIGLGAFPLYWLARDKLGAGAGLALSAAYLLYLPLHFLNLYEYQPRAFAIGPVLAMFHFLDSGKLRPFVISMLLVLTTRVDASLTVAAIGLYALLRRRPPAFGLSALALGLGYFGVVVFLVTPRFNTTGRFVFLRFYDYLGGTPGDILWTMLTRPLFVIENATAPPKLAFLLKVYGVLAFLPFLRPDVLLIAAPTLAMCLLSARQVDWDVRYSYPAMLYPTAFIGVVVAIASLARFGAFARRFGPATARRTLTTLVLAANILPHVLLDDSPAWRWLRPGHPPSFARAAERLVAQVPAGASVAVSSALSARVARRERLYPVFSRHGLYVDDGLAKADYALVDPASEPDPAPLAALKSDPDWLLVDRAKRLLLFRRRERPTDTAVAGPQGAEAPRGRP